jgi:hypothetical protein
MTRHTSFPAELQGPDPKALVTEARMEVELNRVSEACEQALNRFQRDLISGQSRANLVWNVVNVVLGSLMEKGLLTEADVVAAGEDLWKQTIENSKITQRAIKAKKPVEGGDLKKTPLDKVTRIMTGIHERMKHQQKEEEHVDQSEQGDAGNQGEDLGGR